jgi:GNAT superfamily N-acetyltransferase
MFISRKNNLPITNNLKHKLIPPTPMPPLSIVPYEPGHAPALMRLLQALTPAYFHPSEAPDYAAYLAEEAEEYFVAFLGPRLVGAGGINRFPEQGLARLSWDLVHPEGQGLGVGRELVRHRVARLRQDGFDIVVRTSQLAAAFYAKQGFGLVATQADYWAPGFDLHEMRWMG